MNTYQTSGKADIYQVQIHEFPQLIGKVYLVFYGKYRVLIDTGSGFGDSNTEIEQGFTEVGSLRGEPVTFEQLSHIFFTHGHIDHFGGLPYILEQSKARVCIHELDRRIVSTHEERLSLAAHRLEEFLTEAGVSHEQRENELGMYKITKSLYCSVPVDVTYEAAGMHIGPFRFIHVPGHCAGHVLIRLHDVLFSGDHILENTSPHQAPEQITLSTGLETYLSSLEIARKLAKKVRVTLGGHENPVHDLKKRIDEIRQVHWDRLHLILNLLEKPHTIAEVSKNLFGKVEGYTVLLALEEAGAHVEYLYQRGFLKIANLAEVEESPKLVPIQYKCVECTLDHI
jgi:glyoxylase-like metal-dependent hydrolase (beta-lactamase superfamily II)